MSAGGGESTAPAVRIRGIDPRDDRIVAALIRATMAELDCAGDGSSAHDPEVDAMSRAYRGLGARFYVVERHDRVLGCGGFGPLQGVAASARTCELRKMYFARALRGRGAGRVFLERLLAAMVDAGYRRCYLETTTRMSAARALYAKLGFAELEAPIGDTGHGACGRYFARDL